MGDHETADYGGSQTSQTGYGVGRISFSGPGARVPDFAQQIGPRVDRPVGEITVEVDTYRSLVNMLDSELDQFHQSISSVVSPLPPFGKPETDPGRSSLLATQMAENNQNLGRLIDVLRVIRANVNL